MKKNCAIFVDRGEKLQIFQQEMKKAKSNNRRKVLQEVRQFNVRELEAAMKVHHCASVSVLICINNAEGLQPGSIVFNCILQKA